MCMCVCVCVCGGGWGDQDVKFVVKRMNESVPEYPKGGPKVGWLVWWRWGQMSKKYK